MLLTPTHNSTVDSNQAVSQFIVACRHTPQPSEPIYLFYLKDNKAIQTILRFISLFYLILGKEEMGAVTVTVYFHTTLDRPDPWGLIGSSGSVPS